ncbi:MAG: hypothetical protein LC754_10020 [Acidobacteria bacterium]|nr:hypothetical protein [Acidobacteriota bacterium]
MNNRRSTILTFALAALAFLLLPVVASAQDNRPVWEEIRDRAQRDGDYGRDRDHRHDDDRDNGNHRPGRISDYDRRVLRDVARRIKDRSRGFQRNLDRLLDDSRYDGTRREDHINGDVRNFRQAAERFESRAGDSNDLNRSAGEARELIETASHVGRYVSRVRLDSRTRSDWSQIRSDLRTVADIYGFRMSDLDNGYGNDGYNRRGRNDDDYRRDDEYRRDRDRRRDTGWRWPQN